MLHGKVNEAERLKCFEEVTHDPEKVKYVYVALINGKLYKNWKNGRFAWTRMCDLKQSLNHSDLHYHLRREGNQIWFDNDVYRTQYDQWTFSREWTKQEMERLIGTGVIKFLKVPIGNLLTEYGTAAGAY